jgi:hypothetical protein
MKKSLFQKVAFALALAAFSVGSANAAIIRIGEANGTANTATGITDGNRISSDVRWTRDNVYVLGRVIFVNDGVTLTIEPGTIIRGLTSAQSGFADEPGTLLVSRGGKIVANGTADCPIIFTSIDDTNVPGGSSTIPTSFTPIIGTAFNAQTLVNNNYTADGIEGNNVFAKSSRWGGVILCGRAHVSANTAGTDTTPADGILDGLVLSDSFAQNVGVGTDIVEGLSTTSGSNVYNKGLAIYGGTQDNDSSGVLRFVSLRHCGFVVGNPTTGNEINGFTICGVGTGTVLEHLEIFQTRDDGFEWFGGKHDGRFMFSLCPQDDGFDGDEGYRGTLQFMTVVMGTQSRNAINTTPKIAGFTTNDYVGQEFTAGDYEYLSPLEWDGGEPDNGNTLPRTNVTFLNLTSLASHTRKLGWNAKLDMLLSVHNAVAEGSSSVDTSANTGGGPFVTNLTWSNVHSNNYASATSSKGAAANLTEIAPVFVEETASQIASDWNNNVGNTTPGAATSDIYTKNGLDLRLASGAAARTLDGSFATPTGFVDADYAGSMLDNNMLAGWSVLERVGVLPTTNVARPFLTISLSGTNPVITFPSAGATIKYVIEKSVDGKVWQVLTTTPVSNATTITHTDTTTTVGAPVSYRAYAL